MNNEHIEQLSAHLHSLYQTEAKRQGDIRHHDDYEALPENIKEFDRVLARYIISREAELVKGVENKRRGIEDSQVSTMLSPLLRDNEMKYIYLKKEWYGKGRWRVLQIFGAKLYLWEIIY